MEGLAFSEAKKKYIVNVLDPVLEAMVEQVLNELPAEPHVFMTRWLRQRAGIPLDKPMVRGIKEENEYLKRQLAECTSCVEELADVVKEKDSKGGKDEKEESEEEDDDDDDVEDMPPPPVRQGQRQSVSAEAYGAWNKVKEFDPPKYPKNPDQIAAIKAILLKSWLFKALDSRNLDIVVLAMEEMSFTAGTRIIKEGEDGAHVFIIEKGNPVCSKMIQGESKVVKTCEPGDVFGELALLYNAPRAATVDSVDDCLCWRLDRETFNQIVKRSSTTRRTSYMSAVKEVSLFMSLDEYERGQLAEVLKREDFKKDDVIVKQGDEGDKMYIVETGALVAMKSVAGAEATQVLTYKDGDYFGELALLSKQPRAASVIVTSDTAKVLSLERHYFDRLLGPLHDVLKRQSAKYN